MKTKTTKPAPKKRKQAQPLVTPDTHRQESETLIEPAERKARELEAKAGLLKKAGQRAKRKRLLKWAVWWRLPDENASANCYTKNELAELFYFGNALPSGCLDAQFGAIASLPAGRLLTLIWGKFFLASQLATPEGREEKKSHHAEIGRVILEAIRGDNPAAFFSQLAKWYKTPRKERSDLKLRDFGIKRGKGRQKQRTDNDFVFPWALGYLIDERNAGNRRGKISLSEIIDQIKAFGGSISETDAYKRVKILGFTRFLAGRKRT